MQQKSKNPAKKTGPIRGGHGLPAIAVIGGNAHRRPKQNRAILMFDIFDMFVTEWRSRTL